MLKPMDSLLSSSDVGQVNRARVIRRLYEDGPLTRADLATSMDVSRATIGQVVQPLLDHAVLIEQAPRTAGVSGGKPSRPLWFGQTQSVGAVYLSADECIVAALSMDGRITVEQRATLDGSRATDDMATLQHLCGSVFADRSLLGVGVAFAGTVDTTSGELIDNYRRPDVSRLPVVSALHDAFAVPVFVDHHPRIQAYGDAWFGLGRGMGSFASVVTGEVIGVGIVQNGHVTRGIRGAGGEAGHMVVDLNGDRCLCGRRGCWETVATLPWLRRQALDAGLPGARRMDAESLAERAASSPAHTDLLNRYADHVALGLANLEQVLGLGAYIVHGDVARGGEAMQHRLQSRLVEASPQREPTPRVILAPGPDTSTLLGATGLVLSNLFQARL